MGDGEKRRGVRLQRWRCRVARGLAFILSGRGKSNRGGRGSDLHFRKHPWLLRGVWSGEGSLMAGTPLMRLSRDDGSGHEDQRPS